MTRSIQSECAAGGPGEVFAFIRGSFRDLTGASRSYGDLKNVKAALAPTCGKKFSRSFFDISVPIRVFALSAPPDSRIGGGRGLSRVSLFCVVWSCLVQFCVIWS